MRRASLLAGALIFAVGVGALAFVRPWGLHLPRWLVIVPALVGSAYAMAHALTAYVTKPLDALGVVRLEFRGWAERHETAQFLWDLLFYEPWFLGLGLLVTAGAVHHYGRTGGTHPAGSSPPRGHDGGADRGGLRARRQSLVVQTSNAPSGGSVPGT